MDRFLELDLVIDSPTSEVFFLLRGWAVIDRAARCPFFLLLRYFSGTTRGKGIVLCR